MSVTATTYIICNLQPLPRSMMTFRNQEKLEGEVARAAAAKQQHVKRRLKRDARARVAVVSERVLEEIYTGRNNRTPKSIGALKVER